jgi:hypothetical protein
MSASDFKFVPNSNPSEFDPSEPVIVSLPSPMSVRSDSPLLVSHDSNSSHQSSDLTNQLQTVVLFEGTEPVAVVGALSRRLIIVLDKSGSMSSKVQKVRKSVDQRTRKANSDGIPVTMFIFSDAVTMHEFPAGQCPPLTSQLYCADGNTALFIAMFMALQKAAEMPTHSQILWTCESDGENNIDGVTISQLRDQFAALKSSHPGFSALMCSSGFRADELALDIGLSRDQVIQLNEDCRDYGAKALDEAQQDFFSSDPGTRAAFSRDAIKSSEGSSHHWQAPPWQSHGSSNGADYADYADDCVPTPGPNGSGPSDQPWSVYDMN